MRLSLTLKIAAALAVLALIIQWFGTGGPNSALDPDDPRVSAARASAVLDASVGHLLEQGQLLKAWLTTTGSGYEVHMGIRQSAQYSYRVWVTFDETGTPVSVQGDLWRGSMLPRYLSLLSFAMFAVWFGGTFVIPHFAPRCPDCPGSLAFPQTLAVRETTVYPGGFDMNGDSLAPIIRQDYVCPRCSYSRVSYYVSGLYRPGNVRRVVALERIVGKSPVGNLDWYWKTLEQWSHENRKKAQFKTHEEWKAFFDDLKASEHEDRGIV